MQRALLLQLFYLSVSLGSTNCIKGYDRVKGNLILMTHQKLLYLSIFPKTGKTCILEMCLQKLTNVTRKTIYYRFIQNGKNKTVRLLKTKGKRENAAKVF